MSSLKYKIKMGELLNHFLSFVKEELTLEEQALLAKVIAASPGKEEVIMSSADTGGVSSELVESLFTKIEPCDVPMFSLGGLRQGGIKPFVDYSYDENTYELIVTVNKRLEVIGKGFTLPG